MMAAPSEGRARGEGDWRLEMEIGGMGVEDNTTANDVLTEMGEEVRGDVTSCGVWEDVKLECYPNPKTAAKAEEEVKKNGEEAKKDDGKVTETKDEAPTMQDAAQQTRPMQPVLVTETEDEATTTHDAAQQTQPAQPALKGEAATKQDAVQQTEPTQPVDVKDLQAATSNQVSPTTTERLQPIPSSAARPSHASQPVSAHHQFLLSEEQRAKLREHMEEKEKRALAKPRKSDPVSIPRRNAGTLSELRVDETREEIALARAEAKRTNTPWPPIFNPSLHMAELRREEEKPKSAAALVSSTG